MPIRRIPLVVFLLAAISSGTLEAAENLLHNPGFEEPLDPTWEKRTPEDASRKLGRLEGVGRSGDWAAVMENVEPAYTRLRQGQDRSIAVDSGSLLELSAWVRSELTSDGGITLQLYCMSQKDDILAQPTSRPIRGPCGWSQMVVRSLVPDGTAYVMAYLQMRDGTGRVIFDDVQLVVQRKPRPRRPAPKIGLLTDLADDNECLASLRTLFTDGLVRLTPNDTEQQLTRCEGALVLFRAEDVPRDSLTAVERFASGGGRVVMDIRNLARWQGCNATRVSVGAKRDGSAQAAMAAGLQVVKDSEATVGFRVGQIMPRANHPEGELFVLPAATSIPDLETLAIAPDGSPGLVRMTVGLGCVFGIDVLSLREPYCRNIDAYYKYAPLTNVLTNRVQFGEYYPKKLAYAEFVDLAKTTAADHPAIHFQDEGRASEDYRLFSLNLGRPGAPLYLLYAAAHGSEWEPGYGLITFAKRIAQGQLDDVIDLDAVQIKIVPILNPWGYDQRKRQNAGGVDLNRQGDYAWETFAGRDSNEDGKWSPGDYDWKGASAFSEPEAQTYKKIVDIAANLYCVLDFHGNSSATSNKVAILPATARKENDLLAMDLQQIANERLKGRHLLRQLNEETCSQYLLTRTQPGGSHPYLMNTSARDRFGLLIELTAGYAESYGTVLQTDVTCELCRALFLAYPPPEKWPIRQ